MPELDDAALERRLRTVLNEHLGALPFDLTVDALDRRREAKGRGRRFGRGRGMTLLAAAALLLVGGALAAGSGILRLPTVVPPVPAPSIVAVATASPDATSRTPNESAAPSTAPIPGAGPGGAWIPTGTMGTPRFGHTAVRLLDGRVLVVGGDTRNDGGNDPGRPPFNPASAEVYDPASGIWSPTESMLKQQAGFPPTLLLDGKVLVGHVDEPAYPDVSTIGAEVYDPDSRTWTATRKMVTGAAVWAADFGSTATLLPDGKVLVAGQGGTQVYDPDSGTWTATGPMITPRHSHSATLLRDGRVLAVGGYDGGDRPLGSAERYDPRTGSWAAAGSPFVIRRNCPGCPPVGGWANLLGDGTLLVMPSGLSEFDAQVYDPTTGTWSAPATPAQPGSPAALLPDDSVLMTDLLEPTGEPAPCTAAALYDPRSGSWTTASSMVRCGNGSFTPLLDGTVLVAGGGDCNGDGVCVPTVAAELYVPAGVSPPALPAFSPPAPPVFPSPTPRPTPFPPAAGPVPPNARTWTVTVDNKSSEPATLFVAELGEGTFRLVGSATPNVVPAGASVKVTFLLPARDDPDSGWIYVNPGPDSGGLFPSTDLPSAGKILITAEGEGGWLSP